MLKLAQIIANEELDKALKEGGGLINEDDVAARVEARLAALPVEEQILIAVEQMKEDLRIGRKSVGDVLAQMRRRDER